jgi:hypothetical protein
MPSAAWYYGREPPEEDGEEWSVETVCQRADNRDETLTCVATGDEISSSTAHLYVTARRETRSYRDDIRHYVLVDEPALRDWLGGDDE